MCLCVCVLCCVCVRVCVCAYTSAYILFAILRGGGGGRYAARNARRHAACCTLCDPRPVATEPPERQAHTHVRMYTYISVYKHKCIHTYMYSHAHTYTQPTPSQRTPVAAPRDSTRWAAQCSRVPPRYPALRPRAYLAPAAPPLGSTRALAPCRPVRPRRIQIAAASPCRLLARPCTVDQPARRAGLEQFPRPQWGSSRPASARCRPRALLVRQTPSRPRAAGAGPPAAYRLRSRRFLRALVQVAQQVVPGGIHDRM